MSLLIQLIVFFIPFLLIAIAFATYPYLRKFNKRITYYIKLIIAFVLIVYLALTKYILVYSNINKLFDDDSTLLLSDRAEMFFLSYPSLILLIFIISFIGNIKKVGQYLSLPAFCLSLLFTFAVLGRSSESITTEYIFFGDDTSRLFYFINTCNLVISMYGLLAYHLRPAYVYIISALSIALIAVYIEGVTLLIGGDVSTSPFVEVNFNKGQAFYFVSIVSSYFLGYFNYILCAMLFFGYFLALYIIIPLLITLLQKTKPYYQDYYSISKEINDLIHLHVLDVSKAVANKKKSDLKEHDKKAIIDLSKINTVKIKTK